MKTKTNVWISPYSEITPADIAEGNPEKLHGLIFHSAETFGSGYTNIGTAEVEVTFFAQSDLIESKRQALEAELKREIAESHVRQEKLREQIQNLLALPCEVQA